MEIVKLEKRESNKAQEYHPRLPAVELIMVVGNGTHNKFDGGFGKQQGVRGEDAADASVGHAFDETHTVGVARVYSSEKKGAEHDEGHDEERSDEPYEELVTAKEGKQLVQVVGGLGYRAEYANEKGTKRDEKGTHQGIPSKGFA
jgi:hypothetical protein